MNKEDIRFYLQTMTLKLYNTLSDTEKVNTDYLINEIRIRSDAFGKEIFNILKELNYHTTPNSSDNIIWRLRKAFFYGIPENTTNSWMVTLKEEGFDLDSTPVIPSSQSIIVIPKSIIFTKEHAKNIMMLGVTRGIILDDNGDIIDSNVILKERVFGARANPSGVKNTDIEKIIMLGLISFFIYFAVSLKKR